MDRATLEKRERVHGRLSTRLFRVGGSQMLPEGAELRGGTEEGQEGRGHVGDQFVYPSLPAVFEGCCRAARTSPPA